jgi:tripartite-type tricarboxylate transporter receptor subunit TctC
MSVSTGPAESHVTRRRLIAGIASLPLIGSGARAQPTFPERPIRLIVPFGPGGAADTFGRQVAHALTPLIGKPVVPENRGGANAIVGTEAVARAVPDGYTLLLGTDQAMCVNPALFQNLPYDAARDFSPVAGLVSLYYVLVVAPNLPVKSVADLVAMAKAEPGRLTFGSTGAGTPARLMGEIFQRDAGVQLTHVPYQSGVGQLFADLLNGTISMLFYPYQSMKPHVEAGRMRALASTSLQRPEWLTELPTLHELGFRKTVGAASIGIYAPAGTAQDRVGRLSDALRQVMAGAELRASLLAAGTSAEFRPPAELAAFTATERSRYREIVLAAGVHVE